MSTEESAVQTMQRVTIEIEREPATQVAYGDDQQRWAAVVGRDRHADGAFYYAVRTTRVYCRPSCAARLPLQRNVEFHATRESAEHAGFRPCKRCRPAELALAEQHAATVAAACRMIEQLETVPSLAVLADAAAMSQGYFHRVFKSLTGLTPHAYAVGHRAQRVRDGISEGATVTEAIHGAGFNSSGTFYAASSSILGMTPGALRRGGSGTVMRFAIGQCSLGAILVAATDKGISAIIMEDDPDALVRHLQDRFPQAELIGGDEEFERTVAQVVGLVESPGVGLDLPLDLQGTTFQQRVWQALREIPAGTTATYTEIAERIGQPQSARAVANACGANPVAVAIPCHRVVHRDGSLSGYRWGVERKRELLAREGVR